MSLSESLNTPTPAPSPTDALISTLLDRTLTDSLLLSSLSQIKRNQQSHERAWFDARALITTKYSTKRHLNALLTSVGGRSGLDDAVIDAQESAEVFAFDQKLRMAMGEMYRSQVSELEKLGVNVLGRGVQVDKVFKILDELVDSVDLKT